jgi:hypothetical protein
MVELAYRWICFDILALIQRKFPGKESVLPGMIVIANDAVTLFARGCLTDARFVIGTCGECAKLHQCCLLLRLWLIPKNHLSQMLRPAGVDLIRLV